MLKQMAPQELDKVLSIKFYAKVKKRNGEDDEPESLKIMQSAIERYLKEKNYPLSVVHWSEFHNSKEIHRRITKALPLIPSPKTTRSLRYKHRRKEGLSSLFQATRIELSEL